MNRDEILSTLRAFPYDPGEYWLVTGAAMVLYGMKEGTQDVDLGCSRLLADRLEAEGVPFRLTDDGKRWFCYSGTIELFEGWQAGDCLSVGGYSVVSPSALLQMKLSLGREKDRADIEAIRAWLARRKGAETP
ncbi:MAG: hypothetical protein K6G17_08085 [Oscillospiraceae bacterium]|nr:hypothetical protein [Oscillospiraceae bacterium]